MAGVLLYRVRLRLCHKTSEHIGNDGNQRFASITLAPYIAARYCNGRLNACMRMSAMYRASLSFAIMPRTANRYLKRIKYSNRVSRLIQPDLSLASWMFEVVFDYADHPRGSLAIYGEEEARS